MDREAQGQTAHGSAHLPDFIPSRPSLDTLALLLSFELAKLVSALERGAARKPAPGEPSGSFPLRSFQLKCCSLQETFLALFSITQFYFLLNAYHYLR